MEFEINAEFATLDDEALAEYATSAREAFTAFTAIESPTDEQIEAAEALADHIEALKSESDGRVTAAAERDERLEALRNRFAEDQAAGEPDPDEDEPDGDDEPEGDDDAEDDKDDKAEAAAEVAAAATTKKASTVKKIAARSSKPKPPAPMNAPVTITAAADVPEIPTGSALPSMEAVGKALVNRMRGFGTPAGDGSREELTRYGVATFKLDFDEDMTIDRGSDDLEVLTRATQESRLPGGSLVAAGGWCAPSETLYDLCTGETTEGILSLPEVNVARGGIKFTKGPTFADIYDNVGFDQTEAQAISGTTKTCYEVPCPSWTDVRLDAVGLCIKAPILTNAAYPELINRWLSGAMVAHQHKVNAKVIGKMVTAAGAARVFAGLGATATDSLEALELVALQRRQVFRLGLNASMEVVVPHWVKAAFRADISRRNGIEATNPITDAIIAAEFAARNLNVQYVYDWQNFDTTAEVYPATYQALVYPAGTFVKGTADVINLSAVYDAASLATNIYTGLFFEEGVLVANMCYDADLVTLPICNAGATGEPVLACA